MRRRRPRAACPPALAAPAPAPSRTPSLHLPPPSRPRPPKLSRLTSEASSLLDVLGGSLDDLAVLTAPIHSRATALTAAQRNVAATKAEVDALLDALDTPRRAAAALHAGPAVDLAAFMEALEALERAVAFLHGHPRLAAVQAALGHAQGLFNHALETCHVDFAATLADGARAAAPPPAWVAQHLGDAITGAIRLLPWDGRCRGGTQPSARSEGAYSRQRRAPKPRAPPAPRLAPRPTPLPPNPHPPAESRESLTLALVPPEVVPKLQRMAVVMLDAAYEPVREGYVAGRDRALEAALRSVGQETPPPAALAALTPAAMERAIAAWARRLRAVVLLALRWGWGRCGRGAAASPGGCTTGAASGPPPAILPTAPLDPLAAQRVGAGDIHMARARRRRIVWPGPRPPPARARSVGARPGGGAESAREGAAAGVRAAGAQPLPARGVPCQPRPHKPPPTHSPTTPAATAAVCAAGHARPGAPRAARAGGRAGAAAAALAAANRRRPPQQRRRAAGPAAARPRRGGRAARVPQPAGARCARGRVAVWRVRGRCRARRVQDPAA
jgi:hypothetical protein